MKWQCRGRMAKCCNSPPPPPSHQKNPTHALETCPFIQMGINNFYQYFEFTVLFESFRNEGFNINPKVKCYSYDSDKYAKFYGAFLGSKLSDTFYMANQNNPYILHGELK